MLSREPETSWCSWEGAHFTVVTQPVWEVRDSRTNEPSDRGGGTDNILSLGDETEGERERKTDRGNGRKPRQRATHTCETRKGNTLKSYILTMICLMLILFKSTTGMQI